MDVLRVNVKVFFIFFSLLLSTPLIQPSNSVSVLDSLTEQYGVTPVTNGTHVIFTGINYDVIVNLENFQTKHKIHDYERMLDFVDEHNLPVYVDYKQFVQDGDFYFETRSDSYKFNTSTCDFETYNGGHVIGSPNQVFKHYGKFSQGNTGIWSDLPANNEQCTIEVNDKQLIVTKSDYNGQSQTGLTYDIIYDFEIDGSFEWTYVLNNLDTLKNNHKFGFTFDCQGACDTTFDQTGFDYANGNHRILNNGDVMTKSELINPLNVEYPIQFDHILRINDRIVDFKEFQHGATYNVQQLNNRVLIDFTDTSILPVNNTLTIDPSYSATLLSGEPNKCTDSAGFGACDAKSEVAASAIQFFKSTPHNREEWPLWVFNVTSIPDNISSVDEIIFEFDNTKWSTSNDNNGDCTIYDIRDGQPSTRTAAQIQTDIEGGNSYATVDQGDCSSPATTQNNLQYTLNAQARSDLLSDVTGGTDYFGFGAKKAWGSWSVPESGYMDDPSLEVTYTSVLPPNAVDDLTSTGIGISSVDLSWSEPELNGEANIGYQVNYTTPQSTSVRTTGTVFQNNTGTNATTITVTGLLSGTDYSATVSSWTIGGNNATFANVYNFTTLSGASTPTGLTVDDISISQLDLDWDDAPSEDNILGFRIFMESPVGNGWTLEVNDTGTTTSSYSDTGLSTKTQYNYMVAGINGTGVGGNSTAVSAYTWGVPDAVSDLSIISQTASTLGLNWTAATPYGYPVTGYLIERESPVGNGFSTLIADAGNVTSYTDTGLAAFTQYNYRITALSSFGNSATSNEAAAYTVTDPPTALTVNDCYHTCTTQLNLEWTAPSGTILGYQIERESPVGNGFSIIVNDTGTTNTWYNNTGLTAGTTYNYRVGAWSAFGVSNPSNTFDYSPHKLPFSVTDLSATETSLSSIDLSWTQPTINSHELLCWMINYTTPLGDPQTIITSCSATTDTEYEITGLSLGAPNSFRVSAVTDHGTNATLGNIVNATAFSEFTIGEIEITSSSNTDIEDVLFERTDNNSTRTTITVRYPNTVTDFRCDLAYTYAQTNKTYTGLTATAYDTDYDQSSFILDNHDSEIVDFDCWDAAAPTINGQYTKPQTDFPFKDQIDDYRAGEFGLSGDFGGIDLVTLIVIIVSMVGFSRTNPAAGVIISVMILGATATLGIITLPTTVISALVLVVILAIVVTRK